MATDQALRLSPAEYLLFEREAATRHEYVDGEVREMTGASLPHNLIACNIAHSFKTRTEGHPFLVCQSDMRVRIPDGPYYYPDVVLAPFPPELEDADRDTLLNPLVIVEVLSPSTRRIDRGEKLDDYRLIPSLTGYLIVAQDRAWIDHWSRERGRWTLKECGTPSDRVRLTDPLGDLALADAYKQVFPT